MQPLTSPLKQQNLWWSQHLRAWGTLRSASGELLQAGQDAFLECLHLLRGEPGQSSSSSSLQLNDGETLLLPLLFICFGRIWLLTTSWTVAREAPLSTGLPRQKYWSGLPFPSPGDLPNPGMEPASPALQADSLPLSHQGSLILPWRQQSDQRVVWHYHPLDKVGCRHLSASRTQGWGPFPLPSAAPGASSSQAAPKFPSSTPPWLACGPKRVRGLLLSASVSSLPTWEGERHWGCPRSSSTPDQLQGDGHQPESQDLGPRPHQCTADWEQCQRNRNDTGPWRGLSCVAWNPRKALRRTPLSPSLGSPARRPSENSYTSSPPTCQSPGQPSPLAGPLGSDLSRKPA